MDKYFRAAKNAAKKSDVETIKVGACLVNKGIFIGYNTKKTHPLLPEVYRSTLSQHAEFRAILNAKKKADGGILYVYRESKTGDIKKARPCDDCLGFAISRGIIQIYYTINNKIYGEINCSISEYEYYYDVQPSVFNTRQIFPSEN